MRIGKPTSVMGAETDEILREAGYSDGEIAALKAAGAVAGPEA
jgi:crotonobetainyl-CoA:carnitine CoA-transferase CaiB-like acyl-CoA transferase